MIDQRVALVESSSTVFRERTCQHVCDRSQTPIPQGQVHGNPW